MPCPSPPIPARRGIDHTATSKVDNDIFDHLFSLRSWIPYRIRDSSRDCALLLEGLLLCLSTTGICCEARLPSAIVTSVARWHEARRSGQGCGDGKGPASAQDRLAFPGRHFQGRKNASLSRRRGCGDTATAFPRWSRIKQHGRGRVYLQRLCAGLCPHPIPCWQYTDRMLVMGGVPFYETMPVDMRDLE
jgi:hypothetical protein